MQNVDAADFAVNGATTAAVTNVSPVSTSIYDITVSGGNLASFNGVVGLDLAAGQNITDLAGNPLPAGEPAADETYTVFQPSERLTNGGFETYAGASRIPKGWKAAKFSLLDGKDKKVKKFGKASLKIVGGGSITKTLAQTLSLSGVAGDAFDLSFWVKGSALPKAGTCKMDVTFYNGAAKVGSFSRPCPTTSNFKWKKVIAPTYTTTAAYTKVIIKITFKKASGAIWFDGVSLMR